MARIEFGNSWWGKKWLEAFNHTDYSNRLPRGKRYARNNYVKSIEIDKHKVVASVRGSRPTPYRVNLALVPFSKAQKERALNIITENPLYLSSLLTRQLPMELYDEFKFAGIKIFPESWHDIKAGCSCPDWADCCKHIAAVIYLVASQIDQNPFLVLNLHRLNIIEALEKRGYRIESIEQSHVTFVKERLLTTAPTIAKWAFDKDRLEAIDFSKTPVLSERLLSLLSDKPHLPCKKDFKLTLGKAYRFFSKEMRLFMQMDAGGSAEQESHNTEVFTEIHIDVDDELGLHKILLCADSERIEVGTIDDIVDLLLDIPARKLPYHHEKLVALTMVLHFSIKLLEQGAYIPEILAIGPHYNICWRPALLNDAVQTVFDHLSAISPPDMVQVTGKRKLFLAPEQQLITLISIFLSAFMRMFSEHRREFSDEKIARVFFQGETLQVNKFEQKEVPNTIALWLSRFYITHKEYVPLVKVEELAQQQFSIEILVENRNQALSAPIPLKHILKHKKYEAVRFEVLKDCNLLAEQFPEMNTVLGSGGTRKLLLSAAEFSEIFFAHLPILKLLGIPVLLPRALKTLIRPRLSVAVREKASVNTKSYLSMDEMLDFNWQVALGDKFVSLSDFRRLVKEGRGLVKIKGQYIYLQEKDIQKILDQAGREPQLSSREKLQTILADEYQGVGIKLDTKARQLIKVLLKVDKIEPPESLLARLRAYQQRGYEWLLKNTQVGFGSLIADDMGLGKTVQVITLLLQMKKQQRLSGKPALIIVPTTLLTNWQREIEKFTPSLKTHIYHGAKRKLQTKNFDLLITTYGLVRSDLKQFEQKRWPIVVIDEAQNIKNPLTAQTRAIKKLKTDIRIAMTGTPVENRLTDYWSIFDFLNRGYLNNLNAFKKEYAIPIEVNRDKQKLERFKRITAPFLLRREKTDKSIIRDLPDKMEFNQYCKLNKEQSALYQSVMEETMAIIEGKEESGIERKGLVLKLITSLKQICNHPSHFLKTGNISPRLSGKTELLLELLDTIYENEEKVLIFTQYTEMGALLETLLQSTFDAGVQFFHGGLSRKKRDDMVDKFQQAPHVKIMILSLKAGGTGLNLTAAQNVIHYDLWWNPAVEAQATDRAYRIGQKRNVMVHRLISKGTFEEKIDQMIKDKKELANMTVNKGEKWIGDFSNKELREMFLLEV